jgi:cupin fold WbuC family metalloprotein
MQITDKLLDELQARAAETPRLRMHLDLRNNDEELSQRMLNALLPGTPLPIHRHTDTNETVIILQGNMDEVFYDASGKEIDRIHLNPSTGEYGVQIPANQYHGVEVYEPSVIVEFKAGKYDRDSTEDYL